MPRLVWMVMLCLLTLPLSTLAQGDPEACPAFVFEALDTVAEVCDATTRNEACYGNAVVTAELIPDAAAIDFADVGDIVPVADLRRLQLEAMDLVDSTWGVALLRLQADLPDTLPGQNVTLLLFGDVTLDNAPPPAEDGDEETFGPMQAFYFSTSLGDPPCAEAPVSGLLIQTPEDAEQAITLTINEAEVTLGSTAFLQAEAGSEMVISLLEGEGRVTADGETQTVPAGSQTRLPLDEDLAAAGPPSPPEPFDEEQLIALPLGLLAEEIEVPEPLTEDEIAEYLAMQASSDSASLVGTWAVESSVMAIACANFSQEMDLTAEGRGDLLTVTLADDGVSLIISSPEASYTFVWATDGTYTSSITMEGTTSALTLNILDENTVEVVMSGVQEGCTYATTTVLGRVGDAE